MDNKNLNPGETKAPSSVQSVNDRSDLATLKQQWPANSAEGLCLKRYGDREHFLKFFNPGMQNYFCQPRFYDYIFCGGAPELGVVERAYGRPCLESWLMIQLADLFEFFSSQDALTTQQLEQAAGLIANQFSPVSNPGFFNRFLAVGSDTPIIADNLTAFISYPFNNLLLFSCSPTLLMWGILCYSFVSSK